MLSIDINTISVTPFQKRVYHLLNQIPAGRVTTYAALARALQTSPRAIGNALRNNIYAPQIPCHRCVSSNGYVNGYDGVVVKKSAFTLAEDRSVNGRHITQSVAKGAKAKAQRVLRDATIPPSGINIQMKLALLDKEGVYFDSKGILLKRDKVLFDGPWDTI